MLLCPTTQAQQKKLTTPKGSSQEVEQEQARLTFDLGRFEIKEIRPTRNETTKISFKAHLAMRPEFTADDLEQFELWRHRFRDQVITAVRSAQTKDFHEPQLKRIRRIILFRVGRMLKESHVEDILFSEFTFSME